MGSNSIVRALPRLGLVVLVVGMVGGAGAASSSRAAATWQWYKADVHVHASAVSPDAAQDLGVMSNAAKAQGLNAVFLTDHGAGSNQPIASAIVNHIVFDDAFNYWKTATYGTLTGNATPTLGIPPSGAASGSTSLHLTASSAGYGESITWYKRGPNLRSGDLVLRFSVYPVRIDPGSGAYVSLAIGGDSTLRDATGTGCDSTSGKGGPPNGYTTSAGVISPGKSNVFVWQLGTPRASSSDPNTRVFTQQLSYTPNTWNTYTIDVTQALNQIPAADRPDDSNGLEALKMVAAASGGTADAYFDNYHLDASTPVPSGNEFVYRNSIVHRYDTSTFKTFPGLEAGSSQHATRFDYDITDPSQYSYYSTGPPSILPTQQSGYPAQLDHPAFPGGATQAAAVANNAYGADLMEAVPRGGNEAMITTWDQILKKNIQLIGTWSSDAHRTETLGQGTEIYASSLDFDPLMRSLYEGRIYMANNSFTGQVLLSPDQNPQEPYPARYPIFVSSAATSAKLSMGVSSGVSGDTIKWVQDGTALTSDPVSTSSYAATKSISLATLPTYVRTEVRTSKNVLLAMSEPIFFEGVQGLPMKMTYHVVGVTTPNGRNYTNIAVKGITASNWDAAQSALSLTLVNPAASLVEVVASTGGLTPTGVTVDGATVGPSSSLAAFASAGNSTWFFDGPTGLLHLKSTQGSAAGTAVRVAFSTAVDSQPPTAPTNLHQTGSTLTSVSLAWNASNDNVGVANYNVYVDGFLSASPSATTVTVGSLTCGTTHTVAVEATDAAGNVSPQAVTSAATATCPPTTTRIAVADAYVDQSAGSTNFGTATKLRVDTSPDVRSYLRFDLTGVTGIVSATLEIYATSSQSSGFDVHGVTDNTWSETGINYANAPAPTVAVAGSSGPAVTGAWTSTDVTSIVTGGGLVSFALTGKSTTALSLASRESGATAPKLVVTTTGGSGDNQPPTTPSNVHATGSTTTSVSFGWTASTDDVGVDHYTVFVDGGAAGQTGTTSFTATGLSCGTSHTFSVQAFDAAGNHSPASSPISASTSACTGSVTTFTASADAYVDGSNVGSNFGPATKLRVDTQPDIRSYLKFDVTGLTGTVTKAILTIFATSALPAGYDVRGVADSSWGESTLVYSNAPPVSPTATGTSGAVVASTWTAVDVTALVSGNGVVTVALTGRSTTALAFASREVSATPPQLSITTS